MIDIKAITEIIIIIIIVVIEIGGIITPLEEKKIKISIGIKNPRRILA